MAKKNADKNGPPDGPTEVKAATRDILVAIRGVAGGEDLLPESPEALEGVMRALFGAGWDKDATSLAVRDPRVAIKNRVNGFDRHADKEFPGGRHNANYANMRTRVLEVRNAHWPAKRGGARTVALDGDLADLAAELGL
jgi:hypothetical protein